MTRRALGGSRIVALAWLVFTQLLAFASAAATPGRAPSHAAREVVEVSVVGELGRDPLLRARIASWFDRARFDVHVGATRVLDAQRVLSPSNEAAVSVWVTLEDPRLARLYFVIRAKRDSPPTYLLRDLPLASGLDEIGAEQLAEALNASALAALEGELESSRHELERSLSLERGAAPERDVLDEPRTTVPPARVQFLAEKPPPKEDAQERRNASASAAPFALALALGYALQPRGEQGVQHGPMVGISGLFSAHLGLDLQARGLLPTTHTVNGVPLALYGVSGHLALSYRARLGDSFAVAAFVGPGLEVVHYATQGEQSVSFNPSPPETQTRAHVVLGAHALWGTRFRVGLFGQLAFGLSDSYYTQNGATNSTAAILSRTGVAHTPRVLPTLGVELAL